VVNAFCGERLGGAQDEFFGDFTHLLDDFIEVSLIGTKWFYGYNGSSTGVDFGASTMSGSHLP
jgi:hypothetical protein